MRVTGVTARGHLTERRRAVPTNEGHVAIPAEPHGMTVRR